MRTRLQFNQTLPLGWDFLCHRALLALFYPLNYIYPFEVTGYMAALVDLLSYFVMHKLLTLVNKLQSMSSKHSYCLKTHLAQMHYWHCKGIIFISVYSVCIKFTTLIHTLTIMLKLTQDKVKVKLHLLLIFNIELIKQSCSIPLLTSLSTT